MNYLIMILGYLTAGLLMLAVAYLGGLWGLGIALGVIVGVHSYYRYRRGYWYDELEDLGPY